MSLQPEPTAPRSACSSGSSRRAAVLRNEAPPSAAEPLLDTVMTSGAAAKPLPTLAAIRDHCAAQLCALPEAVRRLRDAAAYPVAYSDRLLDLQRSLKAEIEALEVRGAG